METRITKEQLELAVSSIESSASGVDPADFAGKTFKERALGTARRDADHAGRRIAVANEAQARQRAVRQLKHCIRLLDAAQDGLTDADWAQSSIASILKLEGITIEQLTGSGE